MQHAERMRLPFWPAASILDTPQIVLTWQRIAVEAEAQAAEQRQLQQQQQQRR